jgi:hypothetical protein
MPEDVIWAPFGFLLADDDLASLANALLSDLGG